jgi:putative membrane protein
VRKLSGILAVVAFALAVVVMDPAADELLSVHMTQHLILMVVVAPLLVGACSGVRAPEWSGTAAFAAVAVTAQTAALLLWHIPGMFDFADEHTAVHMLEHTSFVVTAFAAWWVILMPTSSLTVRFAACAGAAFPMLAIGVVMTLAPHPWYTPYAVAVHGSLTPLIDQQTAGALMWGPGGLPYIVAAGWLVGSALRRDELARTATPA